MSKEYLVKLSDEVIAVIAKKVENANENTKQFIKKNYPETEWEYRLGIVDRYPDKIEDWIAVCVEMYLKDSK